MKTTHEIKCNDRIRSIISIVLFLALCFNANGQITGSGTTSYIPKFTGTSAIGNSALFEGSGGTFGLGTTSPTSYLAGTSGLSIYHTSYPGIALANSGKYWLWYMAGTDMRLFESTGDRITIKQGGNVGIGTIGAAELLHVAKDDGAILLTRANGSYGTRILEDFTGGGTIKHQTKLSDNITWQTFMQIGEGGSSAIAHLILQPTAGNVGIGTTAPVTKLHVKGNENYNYVATIENTATSGHQLYIGYNNGADRYGLYILGGAGNSSSYDLKIGTSKFLVRGDGNVGVGTTTPAAKLHLAGNMKMDGTNTIEFGNGLTKEANAGKIGYQAFTSDALDIIGAGTTSVNRKIKFWNEGGAFFAGTVSIGTTSPGSFQLAVEGKIGAREIQVLTGAFPDYVFEKGYQLMPLNQLDIYLQQNKHLPNIPSAKEVEDNKGINLGEMQVKHLEKTEELYLYVIELNKKIEHLQKKNEELSSYIIEQNKNGMKRNK